MLMARALYPAMVERGTGHLVFVASLAGKSRQPRAAPSTTRPSSACAASRSACEQDLGPKGVGFSLVSPGFIREAGMFAEARRQAPARARDRHTQQVGAAVVKAIEQDKVEVTVAPLLQRTLAHAGLASPSLAIRAQSGSTGQKAAKAIADGHPEKSASSAP